MRGGGLRFTLTGAFPRGEPGSPKIADKLPSTRPVTSERTALSLRPVPCPTSFLTQNCIPRFQLRFGGRFPDKCTETLLVRVPTQGFLTAPFLFLFSALEAAVSLGGEGLTPFYGLVSGGREGKFYRVIVLRANTAW